MGSNDSQRNRTRQVILVALLLSILLHQVILTGIGALVDFSPPEEQHHEVVLLDRPEVKEEKEEKEEEPAPPVPPVKPVPPQKKRIAKKRPKVEPSPKPMPEPASETEMASAEPPPEMAGPPALSPAPLPQAPPTPPNLNLDWKGFESIYGKQAAIEREAYAERSLVRRRGIGSFAPRFTAKVKRALATNTSWIKPGNQEPLGPRKRIFHNYIRRIHMASVHPLFADSFLASLPALEPGDPLNNWSLHMVAEFEIFSSGHISEIRVVRTSGNTVFDAGAVDSIYRSSPFPEPPKSVLSWNDRVYIRWGFYRNHRKCGVFNVEPYILKAPGAQKQQISVDEFNIDG